MEDQGETPPPGKSPEFAKLPLSILRLKSLSFAAKCLYARLGLYAGRDGVCNPSDQTLARETGVTDRHVRQLRSELRECNLLSWTRTQKSNRYRVHPPEAYRTPDRNECSAQTGTTDPFTAEEKFRSERKDSSDKKMFSETGSSKHVPSKDVRDHDLLRRNRKNRDSASAHVLRDYPNLRNELRKHLGETDPALPSNNKVIRIIQASEHASETEIIAALRDLRERGYGADHIRTYAYFETALADYFGQKRERKQAAGPCGYNSSVNENRLNRAEFDRLSDSF